MSDRANREAGCLMLRAPVPSPSTVFLTLGGSTAVGAPTVIECVGRPYLRYVAFTDDNCSCVFQTSADNVLWHTFAGRSLVGGVVSTNYNDVAPYNLNGWLLCPGPLCRISVTNSAGVMTVLDFICYFGDR